MSQDTEPSDPIPQGLIHPNGILNHALYYRLLRQATKLPPPPRTTSPCPQATTMLATLNATALRYLLSDLSYTDANAMDLLVDPEKGDIKHELYWNYTFKIHQRADQRARERLTQWARPHSQISADANDEEGVETGDPRALNTEVDASQRIEPDADSQSILPTASEGRTTSRGQSQHQARSRGRSTLRWDFWHGAVLPFTNVGVLQSRIAAGEGQGRRDGGAADLEAAPPPYAP